MTRPKHCWCASLNVEPQAADSPELLSLPAPSLPPVPPSLPPVPLSPLPLSGLLSLPESTVLSLPELLSTVLSLPELLSTVLSLPELLLLLLPPLPLPLSDVLPLPLPLPLLLLPEPLDPEDALPPRSGEADAERERVRLLVTDRDRLEPLEGVTDAEGGLLADTVDAGLLRVGVTDTTGVTDRDSVRDTDLDLEAGRAVPVLDDDAPVDLDFVGDTALVVERVGVTASPLSPLPLSGLLSLPESTVLSLPELLSTVLSLPELGLTLRLGVTLGLGLGLGLALIAAMDTLTLPLAPPHPSTCSQYGWHGAATKVTHE